MVLHTIRAEIQSVFGFGVSVFSRYFLLKYEWNNCVSIFLNTFLLVDRVFLFSFAATHNQTCARLTKEPNEIVIFCLFPAVFFFTLIYSITQGKH